MQSDYFSRIINAYTLGSRIANATEQRKINHPQPLLSKEGGLPQKKKKLCDFVSLCSKTINKNDKLKFMEKLVSIISQGAHSQRQFNGKDGQPTVFHYMDFVLTDGIDTFHAQATGNLAQALQPLDPNVLHMVQCHISHRTFDRTDKRTGEVTVGHENVIYIDRIV